MTIEFKDGCEVCRSLLDFNHKIENRSDPVNEVDEHRHANEGRTGQVRLASGVHPDMVGVKALSQEAKVAADDGNLFKLGHPHSIPVASSGVGGTGESA